MKILAINGSPRKNKNTAQLLQQVLEGAASVGAETEFMHLRDRQYKGCISCFHCKQMGGKSYGRCILRDDLTPVLDAAHEADILVLGSPIYFNTEPGMTRSFMERLWFQYFLYTTKKPPLSPRKKKTALVYTMNITEEEIPAYKTDVTINGASFYMEKIFGPCDVFLCTDTKQVADYSKYEFDYFDPIAKDARYEIAFPKDLKRAFALGVNLVS